jgi:hypothetical protein
MQNLIVTETLSLATKFLTIAYHPEAMTNWLCRPAPMNTFLMEVHSSYKRLIQVNSRPLSYLSQNISTYYQSKCHTTLHTMYTYHHAKLLQNVHYVEHSPLADTHSVSREENSNKHGPYQIHLRQCIMFSKELV